MSRLTELLTEFLGGVELPEEARSLIAEAEAAIDKRREDAAYIEYLEAQNKDLRAKLGIPAAGQGLDFDEATGTQIEPASGLRYCTRCLVSGKRVPLKNEAHGWKCMACRLGYPDPKRPYPIIDYGPSGFQ